MGENLCSFEHGYLCTIFNSNQISTESPFFINANIIFINLVTIASLYQTI